MIAYGDATTEMVRRLPELRVCADRQVADWDNDGGERPGPYLVLNDLCGVCVEVLASLPSGAAVELDLTRRLLDFGEVLVGSDDLEVRSLGIDAIAERLDLHPGGRGLVDTVGGPALRSWFADHGRTQGPWRDPVEIIDLWGVRSQVAEHSGVALADLAGVSEPARHHAADSLEDARRHPDGAVLLTAYGTSHLLVAARAAMVLCREAELQRLAVELAPDWHDHHGHDAAAGDPGPRYFVIPQNERVWNMHVGKERHGRFGVELWIAESLRNRGALIRETLSARGADL